MDQMFTRLDGDDVVWADDRREPVVAKQDIEIGDTVVLEGSVVTNASTSRDPEQFPRPPRHHPRAQPPPGLRARHPPLPRRPARPPAITFTLRA